MCVCFLPIQKGKKLSLLIKQLETFASFTAKMLNRVSVEKHLLDKGKYFNVESSKKLSDEQYDYLMSLTKGIKCKAKECFYNAQMLTLEDSYRSNRVKYHEGQFSFGLFPLAHAWITLDGIIVDVTILKDMKSKTRQKDLKDRILGVVPEELEYMGVEIDSEFVIKNMMDTGWALSLLECPDYWDTHKTI